MNEEFRRWTGKQEKEWRAYWRWSFCISHYRKFKFILFLFDFVFVKMFHKQITREQISFHLFVGQLVVLLPVSWEEKKTFEISLHTLFNLYFNLNESYCSMLHPCICVHGLRPDFYQTLKTKQVETRCNATSANKKEFVCVCVCVCTADRRRTVVRMPFLSKSISYLSMDDVNVRECVVDQSFDYHREKEKCKKNISEESKATFNYRSFGAIDPIVFSVLHHDETECEHIAYRW